MSVSTQSAAVFACYDRACAPPPAGRGGSLPRGASGGRRAPSAAKRSKPSASVKGSRSRTEKALKSLGSFSHGRLKLRITGNGGGVFRAFVMSGKRSVGLIDMVVGKDGSVYWEEISLTKPAQGKGFGSAFLKEMIPLLREAGAKEIRLRAQTDADPSYRMVGAAVWGKLGFDITGIPQPELANEMKYFTSSTGHKWPKGLIDRVRSGKASIKEVMDSDPGDFLNGKTKGFTLLYWDGVMRLDDVSLVAAATEVSLAELGEAFETLLIRRRRRKPRTTTAVFACYSKACAPPPAGKGGSLKGGGTAPRTVGAGKVGLSRPASGSQYAVQKQESYDAMEEAILMDNLGGDVSTKVAANERVAGHLSEDEGFRRWIDSTGTHAMSEELRYGLEPIVVGSSRTFSVDQREQIMNELLGIAREHVQNRDLSASRLEDVKWAIKLVEETTSSPSPTFAMLDKLERLFEVSSLHDVARAASTVTGGGKDVYETAAAMVTRMTIDWWAATADNDVQQTAAALEHDTMDALKSYESYKGYTMSARVFMDDVELSQAYVRAEYAATQQWLKEMGIQKVVVYRGMNLPPDTYGNSSQSENIPVNVQMNPLSSWSWASEEALPFTEGDDVGVLFKAVVPASMIQSLPQTGRGCLDEKEVVLIGAGGEALVSVIDD